MRRQRVPQSWGRQALIDRRGIIDLAHQQSSAGYEIALLDPTKYPRKDVVDG